MYDTILIGKDIGSLMAALTCVCRGHQTLLLSDEEAPAPYVASGCTFNADPFPWTGFDTNGSFLSFHLHRTIFQAVSSFLVPLNPGLQIIFPEHRLDIFTGREELLHEVSREFAGCEGRLRALYEAVARADQLLSQLIMAYPALSPVYMKKSPGYIKRIALYLREKSRCDRIIRGFRDDTLRLFFESQLAVFSNMHPSGLRHSPLWPHTLSKPLLGICYPLGGKHAVQKALEDLFTRHGGILLKDVAVDKIAAGTGLYRVDVRTDQGALQCSARFLVVSRAWKNMTRLLNADERKTRRLNGHLRRSKRSLHAFTLHMSVLDRGLPERMAEYVALIADRQKTLRDLNYLFLELSKRNDTGRAPEGKRALSITVLLDRAPSDYSDAELFALADGILARLEGFIPFLSENIDFMDVARCIELARTGEETAGHRYGILPSSFLRLSTLPCKTPLKNVYWTGKDLYADLGFEGEILSGINAGHFCTGGRP
jgi:phytoene dehydrogenase-like protein